MIETDKHTQAFEIYFECRNISEVSRRVKTTRQSVSKWRDLFLWDERCLLREKKIADKLENRVIDGIVDKKAKMLKELDNLTIMVDQEIVTAFEKDETGKVVPKLHAERLKDLIDLFKLKLSINDNRLKILGEDIHKVEVSGTVDQHIDLEDTLNKYAAILQELKENP